MKQQQQQQQAVTEFRYLTWKEAREKLREVVEHHLEVQSQDQLSDSCIDASTNQKHGKCYYKYCNFLDLGVALAASIMLFILSVMSYVGRVASPYPSVSKLSPQADTYVYICDLVGSILAVIASSVSLLVVWARRRAFGCNRHVGVRRALRSFSSYLKKQPSKEEQSSCVNVILPSDIDISTEKHSSAVGPIDLSSGTTLTDVYTVYRSEQWHHVPSLLLVEGDVIALQVGDTSPALAEEIVTLIPSRGSRPANSNAATSSNDQQTSVATATIATNVVQAGEKIAAVERNGISTSCIEVQDYIPALPKGKLIRSPDSKDLLQLCNNMRIFLLKETPLKRFLSMVYLEKRAPQIHRQAMAMRLFLLIVGTAVFIVTLILLLVRPNVLKGDLSLLLPLPLIAIIGVLPMIMPMQITFLEAIGTARILSAAHPLTTVATSPISPTNNFDSSYFIDGSMRECQGGKLFFQYLLEVLRSRLLPEETSDNLIYIVKLALRWISNNASSLDLIPAPPVSTCLLEKLGVVTALCLVDDDLACEPYSTPQQLLIPSSHGLKLLDICPFFDDGSEAADSDNHDNHQSDLRQLFRRHTNSINSSIVSDSDSDERSHFQHQATTPHLRTTPLSTLRKKWRNAKKELHLSSGRQDIIVQSRSDFSAADALSLDETKAESNYYKVQFEDPNWWQYLPSLKCIGLACLLSDGDIEAEHRRRKCDRIGSLDSSTSSAAGQQRQTALDSCVLSLVRHVGVFPQRPQLQSLANCIGFSNKPNSHGSKGDLSLYTEANRFYVVSSRQLSKRLALDRHALGLEDARRWGYLNRDAVCIVIQDHRSKGYHLLTVGNPSVVTDLCTDTWHGEKLTISPLSSNDRKAILDTSQNWYLSDLDVIAFSYAPVPYTLEQRIIGNTTLAATHHHNHNRLLGTALSQLPAVNEQQEAPSYFTAYLVDNRSLADLDVPITKDSGCAEWSLVNNQIFLGMFGSLVSPREEIDYILGQLTTAGVRFVYFSPRNMRRTKELASQMGIDVAWNCAISLRPLDNGQEDPHRMISAYADWDVNARLPHGIEDVKRHLREVDNVPLLVSLFTDATEESTMDMINIFREYHDTVVAVGLSHLSSNEGPFNAADIAIGVDMLLPGVSKSTEAVDHPSSAPHFQSKGHSNKYHTSRAVDIFDPFLHYEEVEFVSSIAAHNCVFNLKGPSTMEYLPAIIAVGRASLDAATSSALFVLNAGLSLAFLSLLSACSVSTCIPYIPTLGAMMYLLILMPMLGLSMAWTDAQSELMSVIPPKNDDSLVFGRDEGKRLYAHMMIRAFLPAMGSHLLYLISLGQMLLVLEPNYLEVNCPEINLTGASWSHVIRCPSLKFYSGTARTWSGSLMLGQMTLCLIVASAGFVFRTRSLREEPPWSRNAIWLLSCVVSLALTVFYMLLSIGGGAATAQVARALPYYYYILSVLFPLVWLFVGEIIKKVDRRHEKRACMLRRLQFETRLGMWSPKENK